jgi:hypothetical protein
MYSLMARDAESEKLWLTNNFKEGGMSIKEWLESDGVHSTLMFLSYIGGFIVAAIIIAKLSGIL